MSDDETSDDDVAAHGYAPADREARRARAEARRGDDESEDDDEDDDDEDEDEDEEYHRRDGYNVVMQFLGD